MALSVSERSVVSLRRKWSLKAEAIIIISRSIRLTRRETGRYGEEIAESLIENGSHHQ